MQADEFAGFAGQRVLLIAPKFFGYERVIKEKLESSGARVDLHSDRPGEGFWTKALIRVNRRLLARRVNRHYDAIIEQASKVSYDHILVIRGEAISKDRVMRLRRTQPHATLTLYLWDAMHYNPNAKVIARYFDRVFSFDRPDVEAHSILEFLPLFYADDFGRAATWPDPPVYDACFIGTIHTDRYRVLERVIANLEEQGRNVFVFCYYPSKTLCFLRSVIDPGFRRFARRYVSFTGMPMAEVIGRICESKALIDINRPSQRGLTMRTIEAVGAQRRLLTTNEQVKEYDLNESRGVQILDRDVPVVDVRLLDDEVPPFADSLRVRYSLSAWLNAIFGAEARIAGTE